MEQTPAEEAGMGFLRKLFGQPYGRRVESEHKTVQGTRKATTNLRGFLFGRKK
jgi:hypothetical protein